MRMLRMLGFAHLAACGGGGRRASSSAPDSVATAATPAAPPAAESTAASPSAGRPLGGGGSESARDDGVGATSDAIQGGSKDVGASGASTVIAHPENIQPGLTSARPLTHLANPRERDSRALQEGKQLFVSYNCGDCHGAEGSGAVGPSLQDGRWHFGGSAGEVFESIAEGRPNGMPAWGGRISDAQIWALVTYVRTLSAGKNVTTENFEGATVPRSGH